MYHDGSHTYIDLDNGNLYFRDQSNNNIIHIMREGAGVQMSEGDFTIPATSKIRFDGSTTGDTYIAETGADYLDITVGGALMLRMQEASTDVTHAPDNVHFGVGDSTDFYMKHDATNSHLINTTGIMYIDHLVQDTDFYVRVNDGGSTINAIVIGMSVII